MAHILVDHISFFLEDFKGLVTRRIPHHYSAQMSQKSEVVSFFLHFSQLWIKILKDKF